jgi:hypothetical protein
LSIKVVVTPTSVAKDQEPHPFEKAFLGRAKEKYNPTLSFYAFENRF